MMSEAALSPAYIPQFPCPDPYVVAESTMNIVEVSSFYKQLVVSNIPKVHCVLLFLVDADAM